MKLEKFRQPCGIQAAACWEAVKSGKLKIGELEHSVIMNATRGHLGGGEDCSRGCGHQVELLDRKVTQVLMEILVKKEWIWWSKTALKVTTALGKMASVFKEGQEVVTEDGLQVWAKKKSRRELEVWSSPQPGEALQPSTKSRTSSGRNADPVQLLLQCSGGVCHGSCFLSYTAESSHHLMAQ